MSSLLRLRGLLAAALLAPFALHAQLSWSSYDTSGNRVAASAAVFDPATGSYQLTIPANSNRVFVANNFVPISATPPATGRTILPVSFSMSANGGFGTGGSVQNKYTAFGLFSTNGTAPGATGNFTDDTGLWFAVYQQSNASFNSRPFGVKAAAPACPASLLGTNTTNYGLGTARGGTGGVITDGMLVDVVMNLVLNSAGTWQIGNSTAATATSTSAPGVLFTDRATGGVTLQRTVYSDTSTSLTGAQTFNQFGFLFENGTASAVTLTLGNLSLVGPPYLVVQPAASSSATLGSSLSLVVTAGGSPAGYQWQFSPDGVVAYADLPGATSASYSIASVAVSDAGFYRLVVSNAAGSNASAPAQVSVTSSAVAPSIQTQPAGATLLVGASHTFSVVASGTGPLAYQWQLSADGGANYADIPGAASASYSISPVALADAGLYRVVVSNSAGSLVSASAALVVRAVPAIVVQPVGALLSAGSTYTLSVGATGTPAPTYQWKFNDADIPGATSASLPLTLSAAVSGAYTVTATNAAGSAASARVYVGIPSTDTRALFPADDSSGANPDTPLSLAFAAPPVVGTAGQIRVYRGDTQALVETIDLGALTLKKSSDSRLVPQRSYRVASRTVGGLAFNYFPVVVSGNTARIYLQAKLAYGVPYYVQIDAGAIVDATGASLVPVAGSAAWNFVTKAAAPDQGAASLVVAADGSGDFTTLQGALDFIPYSPANTIPRTITVRDGVYTELVHVRAGQNLVTIRGETRGGAVVRYLNNGDIYPAQTLYHRGVFLVQASDFRLENLVVQNTTPRYGTQAEAFIVNATTQRVTVSRSSFLSLQDTILAGGQVFFTDSTIEGDVDFMWGDGGCYFQNCEIRSINPGYLTQIRNTQTKPGNVYVNCRLTAASGLADSSVVLARVDPSGYPYSQCVYIDCAMGSHIKPAGWQLDGGATTSATVRFWEYGSTNLAGSPLNIASRPTYNLAATGVGASVVLPNQQIDAATAAFLRIPANVCGFTPAVAPAIDASPAPASLAHGAAHTLSVSATLGYPAATYQWRLNGSPIAGATSATYAIASASAADAGDYTVVVANSAGSVVSATATLAVAAPPVSFANYISSRGLDPATTGAPGANPSGDGLPNLVKFVLGADPLLAQPGLLAPPAREQGPSGPVLAFAYERDAAAATAVASVAVQSTTDLATWTNVAHGVGGASVAVTSLAAGRERVETRVPLASDRLFLRLRVVAP